MFMDACFRLQNVTVLNIWLLVIQPGTIKGVIVPGVHYINEFNPKCTKSLAIRKKL
jgi:hypothetical protein